MNRSNQVFKNHLSMIFFDKKSNRSPAMLDFFSCKSKNIYVELPD